MLYLYKINIEYIKKLNSADNRVHYDISDTYDRKPYIGIVFSIQDYLYLIPLSSPKRKHRNMRNTLDFHKIEDESNFMGVLNINNMIPVFDHPAIIEKIDVENYIESSNDDDVNYGFLLANQVTFINSNVERDTIKDKAKKIYTQYNDNTLAIKVRNRTNNFKKLEKELDTFKKKLDEVDE